MRFHCSTSTFIGVNSILNPMILKEGTGVGDAYVPERSRSSFRAHPAISSQGPPTNQKRKLIQNHET